MASSSKDKMIRSAAVLFQERGYAATGFRDVISHSGAPWGSIYHHFPGGKADLGEATLRYAGSVVDRMLESSGDDPIEAMRRFVAAAKQRLEAAEYRAGCPVVAVATELSDDAPQLVDIAGEVFRSWQDAFALRLRRQGVSRAKAQRLATLAIAAAEGAIVVARAQRSTKPLDDVERELEAAIRAAL